jgi:hypothetical protein
MPEGMPQRGRWHAHGALDDRIPAAAPNAEEEDFRATLISQEAVLSTGRNLAVSWCIAWQLLDSAKSQIPVYAQHESGHIVGLQHEHVRWDQATSIYPGCKLDNDPYVEWPSNWKLTPPDPWSVMGYGECEGSEPSEGISPIDMLGAYYTFNWTERRVTDMAPQTGGRYQRLWAADERPGLLWYLPFPDRLLEWRFDAQQPGPLSFQSVERCLGGESPCAPSDSGGHWHPIMGQFTGGSDALDVFMHGPDAAADVLLRNLRHEGLEGFERIEAPGRTERFRLSVILVLEHEIRFSGIVRDRRAKHSGPSIPMAVMNLWSWMSIRMTGEFPSPDISAAEPTGPTFASTCDEPIHWLFSNTLRCCCAEDE